MMIRLSFEVCGGSFHSLVVCGRTNHVSRVALDIFQTVLMSRATISSSRREAILPACLDEVDAAPFRKAKSSDDEASTSRTFGVDDAPESISRSHTRAFSL